MLRLAGLRLLVGVLRVLVVVVVAPLVLPAIPAHQGANLQARPPAAVLCQLLACQGRLLRGGVLNQRVHLIAHDLVVRGLPRPILHLRGRLDLARLAHSHYIHCPTFGEQLRQGLNGLLITWEMLSNDRALRHLSSVHFGQRCLAPHRVAIGADYKLLRVAQRGRDGGHAGGQRAHALELGDEVQVHPAMRRLPHVLHEEVIRWQV
mmetsp:Transcript_26825/g.68837  ORF Transcript_26825/g.68837 Transcript_26825/m.68837 type:complete len:206 (+) Transcript_26825:325-942(+)